MLNPEKAAKFWDYMQTSISPVLKISGLFSPLQHKNRALSFRPLSPYTAN